MAESQSSHRKEMEGKVIANDIDKSRWGLIFAFIIVIVAIGAGTYITIQGRPISGGIVSLLPLSSIVGAFIYQERANKKSKKNE